MKEIKTIALVEWNWMGHHPMYFAHYVLALEELGLNVLAICPNPDEARKSIDELRNRRGSGKSNGGQTIYREVTVTARRFNSIRPARIAAIDWTIRHFRSIDNTAKKAANESGKQLDLVFYSCMYDWDFEWVHAAGPFMSLPWSGLYLHALSSRRPGQPNPLTGRPPCPEKMFSGRLCKGVGLLDEGITSQAATAIRKPVVAFPDLTDERLPGHPNGQMLVERLKREANGRPIVGLFGNLQRSKGAMTLALVSRHPKMSGVCFAFGGDVWWPSFSAKERQTICELLTSGQNTWNHLMRIPDEEQMNSLLSACDILYAGYLDFPHSSNIMTKAALLKKPLIVSEGYLMAERVRRFHLGEVIPQENVEASVEAILRISGDSTAWVETNQPRWSDYLNEHSFDRLKGALSELFSKI